MKLIPDEDVRVRLDKAWTGSTKPSKFKWKQLVATVEDQIKALQRERKQNFKRIAGLRKAVPTILIVFCYPRLDVNVSTHRNHLLKSPFVIHPKTGKVCVPILDVDNCHDFDPDGVPTLPTLVKELDEAPPATDGATQKDMFEHTSLKPYFDGFEKNFLKPMTKRVQRDWREAAEAKAAHTGEW